MLGHIVRGPDRHVVDILKTDCRDFLFMGLKYEHLSPPTPEYDYLPLSVEVHDPAKSELPIQENMYLPIRIKGAFPNLVPKVSFSSLFIMEVDEFVMTTFDNRVVSAMDSETPDELLVFNISTPLKPEEGKIVHLHDRTRTITSFVQSDLMKQKIAYVPPSKRYPDRKVFQVGFTVVDSEFSHSLPITVHIAVRPSSVNSHRAIIEKGLTILEGQSQTLTTGHLHIQGIRSNNKVKVIAKGGLYYGSLIINGKTGMVFSLNDLQTGKVIYKHDDSDSSRDYIELRVKEGKRKVQARLPITIIPKDDSPPYLVSNLGLQVKKSGHVQITNGMLSAHDRDSDDLDIVFKVIKQPTKGELLRKYRPSSTGQPITKFSQLELSQGYIYYHHLGGEEKRDSFLFLLQDQHDPPNKSDLYKINITINTVLDSPPSAVAGITQSLSVKETEVAYILKRHLEYVDVESKPEHLLYSVTTQPFFLTSSETLDAGRIVATDNITLLMKDPRAVPIMSFTQAQINQVKIAYMPPLQDIGPSPRQVRLLYQISDGKGNKIMGQHFDITVLPVNDKLPELHIRTIGVPEGGAANIPPEDVVGFDPDTLREDLVLYLDAAPKHGRVQRAGKTLTKGASFSLIDIDNSIIRYTHDGSESQTDQFPISLSDGVHRVSSLIRIEVDPVDDQPPRLSHDLKTQLSVSEGGQVLIGTANLAAHDNDTKDERISFVVLRPPTKGVIMMNKEQVSRFTQRDITANRVYYVHSGDEIGDLAQIDMVTFVVSDKTENTLSFPPHYPTVTLNLTVIPQNNRKPQVIVSERPLVVSEGDKVKLTTMDLNARDPDSPSSDLWFMVIQQPLWGYIEDTKPDKTRSEVALAGNAVSSFSLQNLKDGSIWYVQSNHSQVEPKADMFEVYVTDGQMKSLPAQVNVKILPQNDEIPFVSTQDIMVTEGARVTLDENAIKVVDLDDPAEKVVLSIESQPKYGQLTLLNMMYSDDGGLEMPMHEVNVKEFLNNMQLVYKHDGSEHYEDKFMIKISDGQYTVKKSIAVHVKPINDEIPEIIRNEGLKVEYGEAGIISKQYLQAIDSDNTNGEIVFVITKWPEKGMLEHMEKVLDDKTEVWGGLRQNFTQADIDAGRLRYTHTGQMDGTTGGTDYIEFYLTDGQFRQQSRSFRIEIENFRNGDLAVLNRGMDVKEGTRTVVNTNALSAMDDSSYGEDIRFTIISPPRYGQFELLTTPGEAVSNFSQMDLAANKVAYSHKAKTYAPEDVMVFIVANGFSRVKKGIFVIRIISTDVALPILKISSSFKVKQMSQEGITESNLKAIDPDTTNKKLTFTIKKFPLFGKLYKGDKEITSTFTQADIRNNSLYYRNENGNTTFDNFTFTLSDGRHHEFLYNNTRHDSPVTFPIVIEKKDPLPPITLTNKKPDSLERIGKDGQGYSITSKYLRARSSLSLSEDLLYVITERPLYGYLENTRLHKMIKKKFSQKDLDKGDVLYLLGEDVKATNDSFEFRVEDQAGNVLKNQRFNMSWSAVTFTTSHKVVCENVGSLTLDVKRSGDVSGSAFVDVKVKAMSAKEFQDFIPPAIQQIKFDPGVTSVPVTLSIKNDNIEEKNEKFRVLLKNPQNAIQGKFAKISIQIINADQHGRCAEYIGMITKDEPDPFNVLPPSGRHRNQDFSIFNFHGGEAIPTLPPGDRSLDREGDKPTDKKAHKKRKHRKQKKRKKNKRLFQDSADSAPTEGAAVDLISTRPLTAPQRCGPATRGLLHFDKPHKKLYECNGKTWVPWQPIAKKISKSKQQTKKKEKKGCERGWVLHRTYCYKFFEEKLTWDEAENTCVKKHGGHLATVTSSKHQRWLWKRSGRQPFWIGLNDKGRTMVWQYVSGKPVMYTNWRAGFPKNQKSLNKHCVLVFRGMQWINRPCQKSKLRFVCAKQTGMA